MRRVTQLPADAGIGSNDRGALERAEQADSRLPAQADHTREPQSPVIKSPMTGKMPPGWRPGVGPKFPAGV